MITNAEAASISVPLQDTDKIIGVFTGTLSITAPTGGLGDTYRQNTASHATGFGESCYVVGVFSTDSGATWNDFGAFTPDLSSGFPVATVECYATCSPTGVVTVKGTNWVIGSASTIQYKLTLMASNSQGDIEPIPTNIATAYSSNSNYLKTFLPGTTTWNVTPGVDNSASANHGLGYVPKVRAFYRKTDNTILPMVWSDPSVPEYLEIDVRVTETTISFFTDSFRSTFHPAFTGQIEWRVYLDA